MRLKNLHVIFTIIAALAVSCTAETPKGDVDSSAHRSVYYWKTTFEIGDSDQQFLDRHRIDRIYLRMFDVDVKEYPGEDTVRVVPVATVQLKSEKPADIEIVPTVFITLQALWRYEENEDALAALITKRVLNMCSYHDLGPISELQFDCDWTESTRAMFDRLCEAAKKILHKEGILLSGTIRLHQIEQAWYPFDKGVLMLYNTGAIKNPETVNSIIAYDDVRKYLGVRERVERFLKARKSNTPVIDFAYPTYCWNVLFERDGRFDRIIREMNYADYPLEWRSGHYYAADFFDLDSGPVIKGQTIRPEQSDINEVKKIKELVRSTIGTCGSNIIYHLDNKNLSKYSYYEIEDILR